MAFDPTKPVQTRDGRKARILCTDMKRLRGETIAAAVMCPNRDEIAISYLPNGRYLHQSDLDHDWDLVNVPEEKTSRLMLCPPIVEWVWVNITTRDNKVVKIELAE